MLYQYKINKLKRKGAKHQAKIATLEAKAQEEEKELVGDPVTFIERKQNNFKMGMAYTKLVVGSISLGGSVGAIAVSTKAANSPYTLIPAVIGAYISFSGLSDINKHNKFIRSCFHYLKIKN